MSAVYWLVSVYILFYFILFYFITLCCCVRVSTYFDLFHIHLLCTDVGFVKCDMCGNVCMCVYGQVVRKMASKIKGEWEMILNTVQANRSCEQKL
jgi:hypothetical protein